MSDDTGASVVAFFLRNARFCAGKIVNVEARQWALLRVRAGDIPLCLCRHSLVRHFGACEGDDCTCKDFDPDKKAPPAKLVMQKAPP